MGKKKDTTAAPKPEPLWNARASAGGRGAHLGVRWAVTVVLILVAVALGARGLRPVNATIINEAPKSSVSSVSEYAAAFADDWFTWDEKNPTDRTSRLSLYNPGLASLGWNGEGVQTVTDARVFAQKDIDDDRYLVTVRITVDTTPAAFYVDVLATAKNGAYAVLSIPSLVPAPLLAGVEIPTETVEVEQDTALSTAIHDQLGLFFQAWGKGDSTLDAFVKADVKLPPLGGGITLASLDQVVVPAVPQGGDTAKRTVTVRVNWNWPGGAVSPATYTVDVVKQADKWFVAAITGGVADPKIAPAQETKPDASKIEPTPTPTDITSPDATGQTDEQWGSDGTNPNGDVADGD